MLTTNLCANLRHLSPEPGRGIGPGGVRKTKPGMNERRRRLTTKLGDMFDQVAAFGFEAYQEERREWPVAVR
jgi:hypothetical protein